MADLGDCVATVLAVKAWTLWSETPCCVGDFVKGSKSEIL